MPRRLAVAKHAGGFDSVGWTLLGFLLGASLAVMALLHADFHGMARSFASPPLAVPPTPAAPVVRYTAPAAQAPAPPPVFLQTTTQPAQPSAPDATPAAPSGSALSFAGAASVHAGAGQAHARSALAPQGSARTSVAPADPQVDADAAAAGMTSRTAPSGSGAAPAQGGPAAELY